MPRQALLPNIKVEPPIYGAKLTPGPSLDELIEPDHLVRVVNKAIEELDLRPLLAHQFRAENFTYDAATDTFSCPAGQPLYFQYAARHTTTTSHSCRR